MIVLVDKSGKICFIGHPRQRQNLEGDIDNLISGKELNSEGTAQPEVKRELSECEKLTIGTVVLYLAWLFITYKFGLFKSEEI